MSRVSSHSGQAAAPSLGQHLCDVYALVYVYHVLPLWMHLHKATRERASLSVRVVFTCDV